MVGVQDAHHAGAIRMSMGKMAVWIPIPGQTSAVYGHRGNLRKFGHPSGSFDRDCLDPHR